MFLDIIVQVPDAIRVALSFRPEVFERFVVYARSQPLSTTVAIMGGASLLIGESVVLFLNQVPRTRFLLSLLLNGVLFALTLTLWATTIWAAARWGLGLDYSLPTVIGLVTLGAAPFVFGFLVLAPHIGPAIARLLYVWSLLIIIRGVSQAFAVSLPEATATVGLGWVLMLVMSRTIGRPVVRLRNFAFTSIVGPTRHESARDILAQVMEARGEIRLPRDRR